MSVRQSAPLGAAAALLLGVIALYRVTLAYILGGRCRFYPSCSVYAQHAVRTHGAVGGLGLIAKRLLRCHPWHPGGLDPVPGSGQASGTPS